MPPAGFEHKIQASEWPKTHSLDRAGTGIGNTLDADSVIAACYWSGIKFHPKSQGTVGD
jgi:hypothetical protein